VTSLIVKIIDEISRFLGLHDITYDDYYEDVDACQFCDDNNNSHTILHVNKNLFGVVVKTKDVQHTWFGDEVRLCHSACQLFDNLTESVFISFYNRDRLVHTINLKTTTVVVIPKYSVTADCTDDD
jgi:hypothetical protein